MSRLEFGIFDTFTSEPHGAPDMYRRHIQRAQLAEQLGYEYFFFIEHQNAGFPCVTSPAVYLAALAQATRTIRIGAMVFQIPLHHPVRLAQDAATVDQISGGRLEFALGYGTRLGEFGPWKLDYSERRAIGIEAMDIVMKAWTNERFSFEGKYWTFDNAHNQPRPHQRPHPPVWVGAHSTASFDYAADHNFNVAQNLDIESAITRKFAYFRDAWKKRNHAGPAPKTMLVRHCHVAETDRLAREEAERYMLEGLIGKGGVERARSLKPEEATPEMLEVARVYIATSESYDYWLDEGLAFVGSPETVAREIEAQQARVGHDILLLEHTIGTMPEALAMKSLKLLGEKVLPAFRQAARV
jgi:alkanesulfonate monooxygenase SsuD/methylene tetrahydromethanopterin reductase-like flavin-dependent oxidoreductase (luciferase family)